jgi:hypothetical protein
MPTTQIAIYHNMILGQHSVFRRIKICTRSTGRAMEATRSKTEINRHQRARFNVGNHSRRSWLQRLKTLMKIKVVARSGARNLCPFYMHASSMIDNCCSQELLNFSSGSWTSPLLDRPSKTIRYRSSLTRSRFVPAPVGSREKCPAVYGCMVNEIMQGSKSLKAWRVA